MAFDNAKLAAFPVPDAAAMNGLSKREYVATMIAQGLVMRNAGLANMAVEAVALADKLLAQLAEPA